MSSQLSSSISAQVSALQAADLKQKLAQQTLSAAQKTLDELNSAVSSLCKPLFDAIQEFKTVPPKIESIVDIQGAANGVYDKLGKMSMSMQSLSNITTSAEVPITLADYEASPQKYMNLYSIEQNKNKVTQEDCLSSGYKKVEWKINPKWQQKLKDQFPKPVDRDVVGKQMEKLINTTIKTAWNTILPPVQTVASIAPVGPLSEMLQSVIDAVDSVAKMASTSVPEDKLNQMIAEKQAASEKAAADAASAMALPNPAGMSASDLAAQAQKTSESAISQAVAGVKEGISGAFENMKAPEIPDDVKKTIEDFKDAIVMVKDNISNIYIVVILKMIGAIFDCFNQIIGVIGVPSIPDPLGKIPQLLSDINNVMTFVMGLPQSLVKCVEAIVKRKVKMIQVSMTPTPPKPLPVKVPVPPTSKDVIKPQTSWDDVEQELVDKYKFDEKTAAEISEAIQCFYDGSDKDGKTTAVIIGGKYVKNSYGTYDHVPTYRNISRYQMQPVECMNKFLPSNAMEYESSFDTGYMISVPVLSSDYKNYYKMEGSKSSDKSYVIYEDEYFDQDFRSKVKK